MEIDIELQNPLVARTKSADHAEEKSAEDGLDGGAAFDRRFASPARLGRFERPLANNRFRDVSQGLIETPHDLRTEPRRERFPRQGDQLPDRFDAQVAQDFDNLGGEPQPLHRQRTKSLRHAPGGSNRGPEAVCRKPGLSGPGTIPCQGPGRADCVGDRDAGTESAMLKIAGDLPGHRLFAAEEMRSR